MTNQTLSRICSTVTVALALPIALILTVIRVTNRVEDDRWEQATDPLAGVIYEGTDHDKPIFEQLEFDFAYGDPLVEQDIVISNTYAELANLPWNDLRATAKSKYGLTVNNKAKLLAAISELLN